MYYVGLYQAENADEQDTHTLKTEHANQWVNHYICNACTDQSRILHFWILDDPAVLRRDKPYFTNNCRCLNPLIFHSRSCRMRNTTSGEIKHGGGHHLELKAVYFHLLHVGVGLYVCCVWHFINQSINQYPERLKYQLDILHARQNNHFYH